MAVDPKEMCHFIQSIQTPLARLFGCGKDDDDVLDVVCDLLNMWGITFREDLWVYKGLTDCRSAFIINGYAVWKGMVYTIGEFKNCGAVECEVDGSNQREICLLE